MISISLILLCNKWLSKKYAAIPGSIGYTLFLYAFYANLLREKAIGNRHFKQYYHPFSSLVIIALTPMAWFVNSYLIRQVNTLSKGLTIKQIDSITKELKAMANKGKKLNTAALDPISCTKRFNNIWSFMLKKRSVSLLNH